MLVVGCAGDPPPVKIPEVTALEKLPPGVHKEAVDIPDVGRVKYTVAIPEEYDGETRVPLAIALHFGYDGDTPDPYTGGALIESLAAGLAELKGIVIAPDALGGDWTDARNEKAVVWLTRAAMKTYAVNSRQVLITGFSMGGQGTWFIGSRHQDLFTGAIAIAAPLARENAEWTVPVYVIHSDRDAIVSYPAAKRHADDLAKKGATVGFKTAKGLTHYETDRYASHLGAAIKWVRGKWRS
jgi:predicted peptidase